MMEEAYDGVAGWWKTIQVAMMVLLLFPTFVIKCAHHEKRYTLHNIIICNTQLMKQQTRNIRRDGNENQLQYICAISDLYINWLLTEGVCIRARQLFMLQLVALSLEKTYEKLNRALHHTEVVSKNSITPLAHVCIYVEHLHI